MIALVLASSALVVNAPAEPVREKERVLVLDLEAVGVDKNVSRAVDPLVLSAASDVDGVEVVAQSELKKLAEMEAARAEIGCDTSSCLAEMADAMGARLVLFGSLSQLGKNTTLALSLYDSKTGSITRETVLVADVGELNTETSPRVRALVEKALGREVQPRVVKPPPEPEPPSKMFLAGVACAIGGGAALVAGGTFATINELTIQDPDALAATKKNAQENGLIGVIAATLGVVVGGLGVGLMVLDGGEG